MTSSGGFKQLFRALSGDVPLTHTPKKRGSTIPKKYCKSSIRVLDPWGIEYSGSRSALHRKAIDSFIDSNRNGFLSLPMENMDSKLR